MVILLNTRTAWDEPPRARHQVAGALAKRHRVYFISQNRFGRPGLQSFEAEPNLTVLLPSWPVAGPRRYKLPLINEMYQGWLFSQVKEMVNPSLVINFDHTATELSRYFPETVYYCNDFHIRNYGIAPIKRYFEYCESQVASRSRFCVGTCGYLQRRLAEFNPNSFEIRLGAPGASEPPVCRKGGYPAKLAFVDFTKEGKTPLGLLEEIDADPRFEIHLYGPVSAGARQRLQRKTNIRMEGILKGEALLKTLRDMDAGIAVYKEDDGNPGRTPNKLWLYLAAGLPCIVTDLPGMRSWTFEDGFVYRVGAAEDFREMIAVAHEENSQELALRRHAFAVGNSWDSRVDELLRIIANGIK